MVVLKPRCSLNHLAMLPVHRLQVSEWSLVPALPFPLTAEPECRSQRDSLVTGGRPRGLGSVGTAPVCGRRRERNRDYRHFLNVPSRNSHTLRHKHTYTHAANTHIHPNTQSHTRRRGRRQTRSSSTSGFQTTQHGSACATATQHTPPSTNLRSPPEDITAPYRSFGTALTDLNTSLFPR